MDEPREDSSQAGCCTICAESGKKSGDWEKESGGKVSSYSGAIEILVCVLASDVTNSSFVTSFFQVPREHIFMINFPT